MEGAAEVFESTLAAQTTRVPVGGARSRANTKEDKLGLQKQVRVQGGSRARSIAASGIATHAIPRRYTHPALVAQTGSRCYSLERGEDLSSQVRTYRVLGNSRHARLVDRQPHVSNIRSVAAGTKGVNGG